MWRALAAVAGAVIVALAIYLLVGGGGGGREVESPDGSAGGGSKLFGFNDDPDPRYFPVQESLDMPVRRLSVPWGAVEAAPGVWDWGQFDAEYKAILDADLRPLIVVGSAPCWAHAETPCNPVAPPGANFDGQWSEYVRRLTVRYGKAIGIEVWNEPNIAASFHPVDPARYTTLLEDAYGAVKQVDHRMEVISGSLFASAASGPAGMADDQFLAAMYAAGAQGSMDAIGAHPYPIVTSASGAPTYDPTGMEQALDRLREVRDSAHQQPTPIWVTETGVSTQTVSGSPPGATESQQADYLLAIVHAVERDPDVPVALIHRLVDLPPTSSGPYPYSPPIPGQGGTVESGFGVFRADGSPKPAACALSREFHGSLDC